MDLIKKILRALGIIKNKIEEEINETVEEVKESVEEVVAVAKEELAKMTKAELKAKANELGVKVDMRKNKDEIVKILEESK